MNAHSTLWYSHIDDHRGQLISDIISISEHIILNTDTPTRVPHKPLKQTTSPDIATISTTLYNRTTCLTIHALNSDHLPIITTINTRTKYKLLQNRHTFINYRKANWTQFTTDTEAASSDIHPPPDIHTANTIFTNIILHEDKHNIPKGKIPSTCKLLPGQIRHKIEHRNNIRAQHASDPSISELNSEITSLIQTHKSDIWREHLNTHWDRKYNTHTLWKTIHRLANKTPTQPKNNTDRITLKLQTTNITFTTTQVQAEIKHSKNNNSTGPDKVNIRHIGPLGLAYLTNMYSTSLNNNIIPHTWKLANIIPILKPNNDMNMNIGTSYRPISLLSAKKPWKRPYSHTSQTTSHTSPHNIASKSTTLQAQHYTT